MRLLPLVILLLMGMCHALKRVLVTGANKGIGREICRRMLADHPECHVILASRSASRGEAAVSAILAQEPTAEGRLELVQLDVEDDASVVAAVEELSSKYGAEPAPLFGLVNNAGIGFGKSIPATLSANFYSQKRVAEAFIPLLDPDDGRICNIASASGPNYVNGLDAPLQQLFTSADTTWEELQAELERQAACTDYEGIAYGLSKAAVNSWTRQLAKAHPKLRINSCSPCAASSRPAHLWQA